jgi:hypothetical protein
VRDGSPEAERFPLGFGTRFVEMSDEHRKLLQQMIDRAKQGEDPY